MPDNSSVKQRSVHVSGSKVKVTCSIVCPQLKMKQKSRQLRIYKWDAKKNG